MWFLCVPQTETFHSILIFSVNGKIYDSMQKYSKEINENARKKTRNITDKLLINKRIIIKGLKIENNGNNDQTSILVSLY